MIEVQYQDGSFLVKGTFSIGIAGVYENRSFQEENICIHDTLEDILDDLSRKPPYFYAPSFRTWRTRGAMAPQSRGSWKRTTTVRKRSSRPT